MSITEVECGETQFVAFGRGMNVASKCLTFHMITFLAKLDFTTEDLLEKTEVYF